MCLGLPGEIAEITVEDPLMRTGKVLFGEISRDINLAMTPDAGVGDFVIVHAGMAISRLDTTEADRFYDLLDSLGAES